MKEQLKAFFPIWKWARLQMIVLMLLTPIIIGTGIVDYQMFSETKREAESAWSTYERIIERKSEGAKVDTKVEAGAYSAEGGSTIEQSAVIPPSSEVAEILPKIHMLESSGGKNDSCKNKGLVNGYGYGQSTFEWRCYKTKAEVEKEVAGWFERKLQKHTLAESLCLYNRGVVTEDCEYAKKFAKL